MSQQQPVRISVQAKPFPFSLPLDKTALLAIDLQRDFLLPGGFGDIQSGTQLSAVQAIFPACQQLLALFRSYSLPIIHTREGHLPDLSDCPTSKNSRSPYGKKIGEKGLPGSRLLVRGEFGHDIHEAFAPRPDELVIDKPGKGAFWNTNLLEELQALGVTHLVVMGVTTECCVTTTVREANDRGFECCVVEECTAGYNDAAFKDTSLGMLYWSDGLFGYVCTLSSITSAFSSLPPILAPKTWNLSSPNALDIATLNAAYKASIVTPTAVITALYTRLLATPKLETIFIYLLPLSTLLKQTRALEQRYPDPHSRPPLYGIPFSIKDSIDLAAVPTTTACDALTYTPSISAAVVTKLISLGAIAIGKTNLDQLATGLTGCRSPFGTPPNVFSPKHVPGGSSSGAAVSVGAGLVSFAVATDTAGSGRVPAGFNGVVGFKPTKGTISFTGVVTACESFDCIAFQTFSVASVRQLWRLTCSFDPTDRMAKHLPAIPRHVNAFPTKPKFKFAVPPRDRLEICSPPYVRLFSAAVKRTQRMGGELVPSEDFWPVFEDAGKLLYDGTFVTERLAGLPKGWVDQHSSSLHPVIRSIFETVKARASSAEDVYRDLHKMMSLRRAAQQILTKIDFLLVPTAPTHPTIAEVAKDPIALNSFLGTFTHVGNVLDLCAVAVPAGMYSAASGGGSGNVMLPFSVTMLAGERRDADVLGWAEEFEDVVEGKGDRARL
ncbi:amidase signature enzyme [Wilcoxina mikolae CBS 423.85]|nr:amidase signature enzyme [Wilcoxina mikolae CBS 423.85]